MRGLGKSNDAKLSGFMLGYYLKYKKEHDDLKEYYEKALKEAEEEHLYSLKAARYDGVKVDGGQHTDIADKIARYEEWRNKTDKHCEYWLNVQNNKAVNSYKGVEEYINNTVPWTAGLFRFREGIWKDCNVQQLQQVLKLKYLECKDNIEIAKLVNMNVADVEIMIHTYVGN